MKKKGFTLVELIISIGIFLFLFIVCMSIFKSQIDSLSYSIQKISAFHNCSKALDVFVAKVNENKSTLDKDSIDPAHKTVRLGSNFLAYANNKIYYNSKEVVHGIDVLDLRVITDDVHNTSILQVYCASKNKNGEILYQLKTFINLDKNIFQE